MERRYFELKEVRAEGGAGEEPTKISGYAALFDEYSEDLGGFREIIRPGAFAESLKNDDIRALWAHDHSRVLGRTKNGTLRLEEDRVGLRIEITPDPETSWGRDALASIRRGDVDQMSFMFSVSPEEDTWEKSRDGVVRTLTKVRLYEVSPVAFPAYTGTQVQARELYGDVPEVPAELRGASDLADSDSDELRAQWSHRDRLIQMAAMAAESAKDE